MNTKTVPSGGTTARTRQASSRVRSRPPTYPYACPFCSEPLHLHGRIGDSDIAATDYCELIQLRALRDGLLSNTEQALKLRNAQLSLSSSEGRSND